MGHGKFPPSVFSGPPLLGCIPSLAVHTQDAQAIGLCSGGEHSPEKRSCLLPDTIPVAVQTSDTRAQCTLGWHQGWPQTGTLGVYLGDSCQAQPQQMGHHKCRGGWLGLVGANITPRPSELVQFLHCHHTSGRGPTNPEKAAKGCMQRLDS